LKKAQWGHTAIYVENGHIVSTMSVFDNQPNKRVSVTEFGRPAVWVAPSDV
jgi:hypothetical protein